MGENEGGPAAFRTAEGCVLSEGFELEDLKRSGEEGVVEVTPCASERGKVMAEIKLSGGDGPFLDMDILRLLLDSYKDHFAEMRCSTRLGVARLMWKARRIYVYEKGKFKIRFAHSREDAMKTLNSLGRLIIGSILCKRCGEPVVECSLGGCNACFPDGPQLVRLENTFNAPLLSRGADSLEEAVKKSRELRKQWISKDGWAVQIEGSVRRRIQEAIEFAMNFSLETRNIENLRFGTTLIALARENLLMLDLERRIFENIKGEAPGKFEKSMESLNGAFWPMSRDIIRKLFDNCNNLGKVDEKTSEVLKILAEIMGSKDTFCGADAENILEELDHRVKRSARLLRRFSHVEG